MSPNDPKLIDSPLSRTFARDGVTVDVFIYRLEDSRWTLEVVDANDTSIVWDDDFETDDEAYAEFIRTVEEEGMGEFKVASLKRRH